MDSDDDIGNEINAQANNGNIIVLCYIKSKTCINLCIPIDNFQIEKLEHLLDEFDVENFEEMDLEEDVSNVEAVTNMQQNTIISGLNFTEKKK